MRIDVHAHYWTDEADAILEHNAMELLGLSH
jgi:hypothetical protein